MEAKFEIISKETIKPSSPTPPHLRKLKLSLLDQTALQIFTPLVFFYQTPQNDSSGSIIHSSKHSLSEILTVFYPLAGRIQENSFIDCDDSGVDFIEARVHGCTISEIVKNPNIEKLDQYLPFKPFSPDKEVMLGVKVTLFDCGGVAIGICMLHKVGDGASLFAFMNQWAKATFHSELKNITQPSFNLASFFPPRDSYATSTTMEILLLSRENIITQRFIFNKEMLAKLKKAFVSSDVELQLRGPTRVEALSGFIWQCFIEIATSSTGKKGVSLCSHVVNLRPRLKNKQYSENIFGNCWGNTTAIMKPEDNPDLAVKLLRVAMRDMNGEYMKEKFDEYMNSRREMAGHRVKGGDCYSFSSWWRFPMYEVNFGWGKPVWVCTTPQDFKNVVIFMSTPCGEGIEAWVCLHKKDMIRMIELVNNFTLNSQ